MPLGNGGGKGGFTIENYLNHIEILIIYSISPVSDVVMSYDKEGHV